MTQAEPTTHAIHPVLADLMDRESIAMLLDLVALAFEEGECGWLEAQRRDFAAHEITPDNGRTYAAGMLVSLGIFADVLLAFAKFWEDPHPNRLKQILGDAEECTAKVSWLVAHALRLSGDITEEQIERARGKYRAAKGDQDAVTDAAVKQMENAFGGVVTMPSRGTN